MDGLNVLVLLAGILGVYILIKPKNTNAPPPPPGPKGLPIIGNIGKDLPPPGGKDWEHWMKHRNLYGPISSITTVGHTLIIVNDVKVAIELLEKRSARYSSRPKMVMATELAGADIFLTMRNDPAAVRGQRKRMHLQLGSDIALSSYYPQLDVEVRRFLLRTSRKPEDLRDHIHTAVAAIILKLVYGYTVEPNGQDPLIHLVETAAEGFGMINQPAAWLVDSIPALKYLPGWLPGAGFKRKAREYRRRFNALADRPFAFVRHQMRKQDFEPSFVSKQIEQAGAQITPEEAEEIKRSAAATYMAGYDTTASTISSFFLAMALYPDAQRKAQEELDRVVGPRLPMPEDRANLPYINALFNEVLRWNPVVQIGIMHAATKDDIYEGYSIPKGVPVVPNIWALTHDPDVYSDPMSFNPERFLESDDHTPERDPHTLAFGFGRRICPGRVLADLNNFLMISHSLAVFQIRKAVKGGKEIDPIVDYQPGIVGHLAAFEINIQPRTAESEALIRSIETEHPLSQGDSAKVLDHCRIPTSPFIIVPRLGEEVHNRNQLPYPLFAKPIATSTSNCISPSNKILRKEDLRGVVEDPRHQFKDQEIPVEKFLEGREFTVAILGKATMPAFDFATRFSKAGRGVGFDMGHVHVDTNDPLVKEMCRISLAAYQALECKDGGRVDIRLSSEGAMPYVIEVNPIFGMRPDYSLFTWIARNNGMEYQDVVGEIIDNALQRRGKQVKITNRSA
ncbi:hypothetical protein BBP40_006384 [Aspergillus hancockii]|nr:hypothetical protein BBP40_006384 [Aspergillus hancockii]